MTLFELLFLAVRLPFAALVYGAQAVGRVVGDLAEIGDGGRALLEGGEYDFAEPELDRVARPPDFAEPDYGLMEAQQANPPSGWQTPLALPAGFARFPTDDVQREPTKEDRKMDQDLSGDMVKVVQYSIVSVVTSAGGGARVLSCPWLLGNGSDAHHHEAGPKDCDLRETNVVAFSDDMTGEDFTSWIMSKHCDSIDYALRNFSGGPQHAKAQSRKYLRVAFSVIGRFAPADINYVELQAGAVAEIAERLKKPIPIPVPVSVTKKKK